MHWGQTWQPTGPSSEGWDMLISAGVQRRTNFSEEDIGAILLSDSKRASLVCGDAFSELFIFFFSFSFYAREAWCKEQNQSLGSGKKKSQGQTWETLTCTSFSSFAIFFLAFTCNLLFIWRVVGLPNGFQCACKSTLCSQHNTAGRKFQSGGARPRAAEGKAFNGSGETAPPRD